MIRILLLSLMIMGSVWAATLDRIVAVVDDEVLLESELRDLERTVVQRLRQNNEAIPSSTILSRQVLERLIIQRLQLQRAAKIGIRVEDDALNAALNQIAGNNNLSLREFRDILEDDGLDFIDFRESIREDMLITRLHKRAVEDRILVSDREIDGYLTTQSVQGGSEANYHLLHILISVPEAALPADIQQAQQKLEKVHSLLKDGASFSEAAIAYSDGQNALEGGELGWRKQGELPSLFASVVPVLNIGEVSRTLRSSSGFHLVLVKDKKHEEIHMVKQTLVSHILIKTDQLTSDDDAKKQLQQLHERLVNGDDFSELAKARSDDTGSAIDGGSLGWSSHGALVPEFEAKMNELELGEMSDVFKSRFGWHIIKVNDRREENMTEEFKRNKARAQIRKRKIEENLESWIRQLRDEAYVEYRDG